jgi:hypothetical protein
LLSLDPSTGISTILSDNSIGTGTTLSTSVSALALDSPNNRAIGQYLNDILSVDLSSGDRTLINVSGISISTDRGAAMNPITGGLLISSAASFDSALLEVDVATGVSSYLSSSSVGSGPLMDTLATPPVVDDVNNVVYLANETQLFKVDLNNGARSIVYDADVSSSNIWVSPKALAFDSGNNRVFIKGAGAYLTPGYDYSSAKALIAIDLSTASLSIVSGLNVGNGVQLDSNYYQYGMVFDDKNNRIILSASAGLIYIDVDSGDRVIMTNYNY